MSSFFKLACEFEKHFTVYPKNHYSARFEIYLTTNDEEIKNIITGALRTEREGREKAFWVTNSVQAGGER